MFSRPSASGKEQTAWSGPLLGAIWPQVAVLVMETSLRKDRDSEEQAVVTLGASLNLVSLRLPLAHTQKQG